MPLDMKTSICDDSQNNIKEILLRHIERGMAHRMQCQGIVGAFRWTTGISLYLYLFPIDECRSFFPPTKREAALHICWPGQKKEDREAECVIWFGGSLLPRKGPHTFSCKHEVCTRMANRDRMPSSSTHSSLKSFTRDHVSDVHVGGNSEPAPMSA